MMLWCVLVGAALAQSPDGRKTRADAEASVVASDAAVDDRKTGVDGPDRSAPPEVLPADIISQPEPAVHALWPGVVAWHVRVPSVRKVEVQVVPRIGALDLLDREDGRGEATGWLMDVAAGGWDSTELEILEDMNDLDVSSGLDQHDGTLGLSVPRDELKLGLDVLGNVVRNPTFKGGDIKLYKREMSIWYDVVAPQSQSQVARSALTHAWYPADHPYGTRTSLEVLQSLKRKDLAGIHEQWISTAPVHVLVVGDVAWKRLEPDLRNALAGVGADADASVKRAFDPRPGTRVVAVDMPGQEQVAIQYRIDGPHSTDDEYPAMRAANWILGGHFLSRLNANLREEKGLTYGSRSSYYADETRGSVTISVDVKAENAAVAVTEIGNEVAQIRDSGVTTDELWAAYASSVSSWNDTRQSAESAMRFYRQLFDRGQTVADGKAELDALGALTPEMVQAAAAKWLAPDAPQLWVFVGSRDALEPQLAELGLEPEWTTAREAIDGTLE
ncbi:MAG: zinc protease [Myxococcota bacterium]|jgi:zinc protease